MLLSIGFHSDAIVQPSNLEVNLNLVLGDEVAALLAVEVVAELLVGVGALVPQQAEVAALLVAEVVAEPLGEVGALAPLQVEVVALLQMGVVLSAL